MANGRVTTREFYEKLEQVEQRLIMRLDKIDESVNQNCVLLEGVQHDIISHENRLDSHAKKIEGLKDSARNAGVIATVIAAIGSTIAAILGVRS